MSLLTTSELARRLQVPERTLDQWAYLGKGPPFIKVGRARRYDESDVQAWLDSRKVVAAG